MSQQVFYTDGTPSREIKDDDEDVERFGGPISPGNLMTLLNACRRKGYEHLIPHDVYDVEKMALEINSWLVPAGGIEAETPTQN